MTGGHIPKAYNELVGRLLSPREREKFEWVVGALLDDGPAQVVIFRGLPGSGKSTLITIVKRLMLLSHDEQIGHRVVFQGPRLYLVDRNTFVFGESSEPSRSVERPFVIRTTGDHLPANKYHVLTELIESEIDAIADICVKTYRSIGETYRSTVSPDQ